MNTIEINKQNILSTSDHYQFIPIGDHDRIFGAGGVLNQLRDKIFKRNSASLEDFWATLGRQDGQAIDWTGQLLCSRVGNDQSTGISGEEVDLLKTLHSGIAKPGNKTLEKVIVFDNVNFGDGPASRQLRLSVMVDPHQGVIVYYQHTTKDDVRSQSGVVEYIHPQQNQNYNDNQRDRLDYFFSVPDDMPAENRFIIKVILFSKDQSDSPETVLRNIEKPYRLLRFNATANSFDDISNPGIVDAQRQLKTLLLIHGTFSTTQGSFGSLYGAGNDWLQKMTTQFGGKYEQIIALDHPTIFEGPVSNVAKLRSLIGVGAKFSKTVDIITTSRGGLVGKTIVNDASIHSDLFVVERVAAQACANGVEYFGAAWKIAKGLAVLKFLFKVANRPGLEIFSAIAQTGVQFFLDQPGPVAMTINSVPLQLILNGKPANADMRYYPVTGNYIPEDLEKRIINVLVNSVYNNRPNDWVVGTTQQAIMPAANYAYRQTKEWNYNYYFGNTFDSIHTQYLGMPAPPPVAQVAKGLPKETIQHFLTDTNVM